MAEELKRQSQPPLRNPDVRYEPSSNAITTAILKLAGVTGKDIVYDQIGRAHV